jgi:hypothetical protein
MSHSTKLTQDTLTIVETSWLAIVVAILLPVALMGWVADASWVNVQISSPTVERVVFVVFLMGEVYLLIRGAWPTKLVVDLNKGKIIITAYCPCIYSPTSIDISEIKKIRVADRYSSNASGRLFNLVIEKHDGKKITFGDSDSVDQRKYEQWRDEIAAFAGIDNITRL